MSLGESLEKVGANITTAVVLGFGTAIAWVVRNILTNGRRLELLEREMKHREQLRELDRKALQDVHDGVKRLEGRIINGGD